MLCKSLCAMLLVSGLVSASITGTYRDSLVDSTILTSVAFKVADTNYAMVLGSNTQGNATIYQINSNGTLVKKVSSTISGYSGTQSSASCTDSSLFIANTNGNINKYKVDVVSGLTKVSTFVGDSIQNYVSGKLWGVQCCSIAACKDTCLVAEGILFDTGYPLTTGPFVLSWYFFSYIFYLRDTKGC